MSEQMHTPSGWTFEAEETSDGMMFSVYDADDWRLTDVGIGEREARLMSAAPDLAESVRALLKLHEAHHNHPVHAAARAALSLASPGKD